MSVRLSVVREFDRDVVKLKMQGVIILEEVLNEMTIASIEEGKCILQDVYSPRYSTMESLIKALDCGERILD